jgi:phosphoribosylanthranilate isomerase
MSIPEKEIERICSRRDNKPCVYIITLRENIANALDCCDGRRMYYYGYTNAIKKVLSKNRNYIMNVDLFTYKYDITAQLVVMILQYHSLKNSEKFHMFNEENIIKAHDHYNYMRICNAFKTNKTKVKSKKNENDNNQLYDYKELIINFMEWAKLSSNTYHDLLNYILSNKITDHDANQFIENCLLNVIVIDIGAVMLI